MTVEVHFENDDIPEIADQAEALDGTGVTVGILGRQSSFYAMIANVHEFGATIEHPGGTPYIVTDTGAVFVSIEKAAELEARDIPVFYTDPHTIEIPERKFLRPAVEEKDQVDEVEEATKQHIDAMLQGLASAEGLVNTVGEVMLNNVRNNMGKYGPPNAQSTIRKKGSARPLVDDGDLIARITWIEDSR